MAETSLRRSGERLRTLFTILRAQPEGMPAAQAIARVADSMTLSDFEQSEYESGGRRFDKILRFNTIVCVKAGWLVKEKGRWFVTDAGIAALKAHPDPESFVKAAIKLYREWEKTQPADEDDVEVDDSDVAAAGITLEEAQEQAWAEIEHYLLNMPPYEFQDLVAALLRAMGYHVGWIAPPGKDGGVDVVAFNDPLGTRPPRIKVQVKRQQGRVSVDGLRSFMAILGADDVGIFVNAGGFTRDAEDEARGQHARRVTLVDLERLVELWTEYRGKLDEAARRRLPLQPVYFLAPEG